MVIGGLIVDEMWIMVFISGVVGFVFGILVVLVVGNVVCILLGVLLVGVFGLGIGSCILWWMKWGWFDIWFYC